MDQNNAWFVFIGVSTKHSAVNFYFPKWCEVLGVKCQLKCIDAPLNASASVYQNILSDIKQSKCVGGLITSHKANIYNSCKALFDEISDLANGLKEISIIYRDSRLKTMLGDSLDSIASKPIIEKLTIENTAWRSGDRNVVILGGGGAGLAIAHSLSKIKLPPYRIFVTEIDEKRRSFLNQTIRSSGLFRCQRIIVKHPQEISEIVNNCGIRPLVINATGLGKDRDGSPELDFIQLSDYSTIWELNYRGKLDFLKIAQTYAIQKNFVIEDGWEYFINGWMNVMCKVFDIDISPQIVDEFFTITNRTPS